jgi:hypothetical protein
MIVENSENRISLLSAKKKRKCFLSNGEGDPHNYARLADARQKTQQMEAAIKEAVLSRFI